MRLEMTDRVMACRNAAELNNSLVAWRFIWQASPDGFWVGLNGFPMLVVENEEQAIWLCEQLNDGLWDAIDQIIRCHERHIKAHFQDSFPLGHSPNTRPYKDYPDAGHFSNDPQASWDFA